jgi:hypothetical protein
MSLFSKIDNWFKKVFKKSTAWNVVALSALNVVAPLIETVLDLADPAAGAAVTPIFTEIQTDLGTVSQLLSSGNTSNLSALLNGIKSNFSALLTEAHITDPASVAKAQAAQATITSELEAIIGNIPAS